MPPDTLCQVLTPDLALDRATVFGRPGNVEQLLEDIAYVSQRGIGCDGSTLGCDERKGTVR